MKVLQINAIFGRGSTGIIVQDIQDCCERNGIDGYVAYSVAGTSIKNNTNYYRIGNNWTEKWHALASRIAGKQAYYNRLTTWFFLRWIDKIKPDVVHLHNLHSNYICLNMLLQHLAQKDIATVITMHDCWFFTGGCFHYANVGCDKWQHECGNCPKRMLDTPAYLYDATKQILNDRKKYLTAIPHLYLVGCSKWVADEAKRSVLKDCDIRHIYNGFDLEVFKPTPSDLIQRLGIEGKKILLGPAGKWLSTVNKETLDYFINTMPSDYMLVLFGAKEHGVFMTNNVLLYGYTSSREEMAKLYSMADVFVNCSREDTLSSLNLEAQACGTPVVTYEATGSSETVDGECGFRVITGDYRSLLEKSEYTIKCGKDSFSNRCINWVKSNYDKKRNFLQYVSLYREIKQQQGRPSQQSKYYKS